MIGDEAEIDPEAASPGAARRVELAGSGNVRDLGPVPTVDGREVAPGLLYRGGSLARLTAGDQSVLFDRRGIGCVIDIRAGWEVAEQPDAVPHGVERLHIPLYDLDVTGYEFLECLPGTHPAGHDVAFDPDRYYRVFCDPRVMPWVAKAVNAMLDRAASGVPVLVHCAGGKDRTGVVVLLVYAVLGATYEAAKADYLETNVSRDRSADWLFDHFRQMCDTDEQTREVMALQRARPENVESFYDEVRRRFGGMDALIEGQLGIDAGRRGELRERLTRPARR